MYFILKDYSWFVVKQGVLDPLEARAVFSLFFVEIVKQDKLAPMCSLILLSTAL